MAGKQPDHPPPPALRRRVTRPPLMAALDLVAVGRGASG